jgi:simple sugar transport system substrate-binding protein
LDSPDFGKISVYDLVMKRYKQVQKSREEFDPFVGPLNDNKGELRLKEGEMGTKAQLLSIDYYVDNVVGDIPR